MAKVRQSAYRQPPTPLGLKAMERGTLEWFDTEMYSNFNTGTLEMYLDEKNRRESFGRLRWSWKKIAIGLVIGTIFAMINQYVGLKVGMVITGAWYVAYLTAMALRFQATELNVVAAASTGASMICTGFVFTFPALYLLAWGENYQPNMTELQHWLYPNSTMIIGIALVATIIAGFLGLLYFIIFRRVWLVEDPLPLPGFEAYVKLMDIANDVTGGAIEQARKSIMIVATTGILTFWFTFLRDFPMLKGKSIMDHYFMGDYYEHGDIIQPYSTAKFTWVGFELTPMMMAIGWFMKFRIALLVSMGTLFTWFIVIPLAVGLHTPLYVHPLGGHIDVASDFFAPSNALAAYNIARIIAIGAILGGGITGLLKMAPVFRTAGKDVVTAFKAGGERRDFEKGRGWYEWPVTHMLVMIIIVGITIPLVFIAGGFPPVQAAIFGLVLIATTFFLGAIAVKVMGETSIEPVSGTSFIVLLMLVIIYQVLGTPPEFIVIMAILGTTVFGGAISMSGNIITDFKNGLYVGNRPYHLMKAELTGIVPGAIVAAIFASVLSYALVNPDPSLRLNLIAPQANAFATFTQILVVGSNMEQIGQLIALGFVIGVFVELMTGMGTAFGLGMYLPLTITLPMLFGGATRDLWEKKWLEPKAKAEKWDERKRTMVLLNTYMVATGLIVGEAILGTVLAIYYITGG